MILHVKKHPDATTIAECREYRGVAPSLPDGYEEMTPQEYQAWVDAEIANGWAPPVVPPPPEPVPQEVGSGQIRAALVALGWITLTNPSNADAEVDAWATALIEGAVPDPATKAIAHLLWRNASTFKRDNQFVLLVATILEKTTEQTDQLFRTASTF